MLDWATVRGLREGQNPAQWRGHLNHLLPARAKVRRILHHPALPYGELPAFMAELRCDTSISARALEFVILTAARTGEGRSARWDEIDLKQRIWIVPGERMKSGREHRVPLSPRAVEILAAMVEVRQGEFVFAGIKQGRPLSEKSLLKVVRRMRPGITVHGFRLDVPGLGGRDDQLSEPRDRDGVGTFGVRRGGGRLSAWRSAREAAKADGGMGGVLRAQHHADVVPLRQQKA